MANTTTRIVPEDVLAERVSADGRVRWQARRSADRGRLIVVGVVAPSATETLVEPLNERQLRDLLEGEALEW